ncbi:efflux RND transporter permease subunit [Thermosulfuriphilus ammonigenes]|uniref:Efflux RND transporter permease subunit n=1 Tax=Thermosulfuriphilus ammonigenes TaxID=1936021 RepID=A0A6G7PUF7_9BACT|nr:efflux RND transporter permease subunit [Thermosulfuriphilus ammonigenes]MBA2848566.1 multidrug efflux pump subunit AcrB [Thermosulfuriphilus ammonigenes]QIJ71292.1 efflux RND transporter permease subunit [Thermosulfuriphilus ammonigenes]
MDQHKDSRNHGLVARITETFVDSKLVPIFIVMTLLLGLFAILNTPSEEEPQIVVPMIDVFVEMPGATAKEIENRVISPMEKLIWEIPGVEYVYSTAENGRALTVVRFYVGQDTEESLVKTYDKLYQHLDWIPPGCSMPLLKPRSIDDVPIVVLTFWGPGYDGYSLRRLVAQVDDEIRNIPGISETFIKGGLRRQVRVLLEPEKIYALGLDLADVSRTIRLQNQARLAGDFSQNNYSFSVRLDNFLATKKDLEETVVKVVKGRPVFLRDVAQILDGPEEPVNYVLFAAGPAARAKGISSEPGQLYPAVSLAISKRKGENATKLAEKILEKIEELRGHLIPDDVQVTVTRNYGETAREKSNELIEHLLIATVSVAVLIALFLGVRASLVVLVAVPVTLAITLFIYYFHGYTLNRVTLFALIFCIGILVDDPIVDVENIVRHLRLPENRGRPLKEIIVTAVNEVRSPLILATFTVIAAIIPMAFVRGLMGPYMRPMPIGASVAMLLSMAVAFVITPWTAYHFLGRKGKIFEEEKEDIFTRYYRWMMGHLIRDWRWRWSFMALVGVLFLGACSLIYFKVVYVKMLPFDNKSEFQVIVDMPEGTTLEETTRVATELGEYLLSQPEVTDYQIYAGTSAPFNFNGLIRHYYLRSGPNVADIQVNLVPKEERELQSHDIAKRVRPGLTEIAQKYGARIKVAEVPPGPPVLQTLVAEIYGPDYEKQIELARKVREIFEKTPGVVDVDWYMTDPQKEYRLIVERDKAVALGVMPARVNEVLRAALSGEEIGLLHDPEAKEDVYIVVRYPRSKRSGLPELSSLKVRAEDGRLVSLSEIVRVEEGLVPHPIYHKNLHPVVYVTGDVAGKEESPIYAIFKMNKLIKELKAPDGYPVKLYWTHLPFSQKEWAIKWDGEWHITYEVFRDLGLAFGAVMILIYMLVVGWFRSYSAPLVIMAPIPLSLIGIIPAHAAMGAFFTATSMIGFIAGAGIVVRNSIILADFIELRLSQGMPLAEAVIDAGAIRFRPMLLTAMSVVVGSFVILFDPIFQGLAISLMAGEVASTLFSRMVVPILYYLDHRIKSERRLVL